MRSSWLAKKFDIDVAWVHWDPALRQRDPVALKEWRTVRQADLEFHRFVSLNFFGSGAE